MPTTTKGFPYPSNSDNVDVPGDMQALAEAVDTYLPAAIGDVTLNGVQTLARKSLKSVQERRTVSATAATGTINFDWLTQGILYYTTSASANFTLNVRGDASNTLASLLDHTNPERNSMTIVFDNTNGATPYYLTAVQIDGSAQTVKWQGGTAPTSGNASAIDSYTVDIVKTGASTYVVRASQVKFA